MIRDRFFPALHLLFIKSVSCTEESKLLKMSLSSTCSVAVNMIVGRNKESSAISAKLTPVHDIPVINVPVNEQFTGDEKSSFVQQFCNKSGCEGN